MGTRTYDFLADSFLFDDKVLDDGFSTISDKDLCVELERYRSFVLDNVEALLSETQSLDGRIRLFSGHQLKPTVEILKQSALYIDCYLLDDPLFALTRKQHPNEQVLNKYLGFPARSEINKVELTSVARSLKLMTPMVAANYVKLLPVSYLFEPPQETPIYYSENQYATGLPPAILKFFQENTVATSLTKTEHGYLVEDTLFPCRAIHISYKGEAETNVGRVEQLFQQEIISEEGGTYTFRIVMPESAPSPEYFHHWVRQTVNKAAVAYFDDIVREATLAYRCGAGFLAKSEFAFKLMQFVDPGEKDLNSRAIDALISVELPFLARVDVETLMKIRGNESEVFESFRLEFAGQVSKLGSCDPGRAGQGAQAIMDEFVEIQLPKINLALAGLKKRALADVVIAIAGLSASVATSGWSLSAIAMAAANGYQTYQSYQKDVRGSPAYFLWKVLHSGSTL